MVMLVDVVSVCLGGWFRTRGRAVGEGGGDDDIRTWWGDVCGYGQRFEGGVASRLSEGICQRRGLARLYP